MSRIDFIHKPRADGSRRRGLRAFLASCAVHGLGICLLLGLAFLYRSQMPPPKSGSAPGAPSISLEKITIISPPPPPPAPQPPKPAPAVGSILALPAPAPTVAATPPPREPEAKPAPPEEGVPVLALQPSKPMQAIQSKAAKTRAAIHPAISPAAAATAQSSPPKPTASASPSSYAPGLNVLPHPPYPIEARDRGQTGTVVMIVQFDAGGDVAAAEVTQSSGVPLLDTATRSFIRAHWHSPAYAGQAVSVPVQYKLENL
jgi:protein TonB